MKTCRPIIIIGVVMIGAMAIVRLISHQSPRVRYVGRRSDTLGCLRVKVQLSLESFSSLDLTGSRVKSLKSFFLALLSWLLAPDHGARDSSERLS